MAGTQDYGATGLIVRDVKFSPTTGGLIGTTTNDSATAGIVGEIVTSGALGATSFPASGTWGDLGSITLTVGDWDVDVLLTAHLNTAVAMTTFAGGTINSSGNVGPSAQGDTRQDGLPPTAASDASLTVSAVRVSLSGSTTMYLKMIAVYSSGTPQAYGRISARRVR